MSGAGTHRGAVSVKQGGSPLVLSIPHAGTEIPPEVAERLNETGLAISDTDWWMPRLYDFADAGKSPLYPFRCSRGFLHVSRTRNVVPTPTFDSTQILPS